MPAVYRDPEQFFRVSYLTNGLQSLLQDVLSRLSGGAGNRVLKLMTPFGGGKTHTLASLFHASGSRKALDVIPEGKALPRPGMVRTAVFDGQFFSPANGKDIPGAPASLLAHGDRSNSPAGMPTLPAKVNTLVSLLTGTSFTTPGMPLPTWLSWPAKSPSS